MNHPLSVTEKKQGGYVYEYDKDGRVTYSLDAHGYWSMCFYHDKQDGKPLGMTPYFVLHKYSNLYNPR